MKDKLYIKIAKSLPNRLMYWCVVWACSKVHIDMMNTKNRDEININMLVEYWLKRAN